MYRIITVLAITLGALGLGLALPERRAGAETSDAASASSPAPPPPAAAESAPSDSAKAGALKAFQRGTAFYKSAEYDKAIEQFESGYQAVPQAVFVYNIAQSHRLANRPERALTYYRKYLQLSPDAKNRPEIEERITTLEKLVGPQLVLTGVAPESEPAPAGMLTPDQEQQVAKQQAAAKRRRTTGIVVGVIGSVLVVGAAVGLGLYFGLPRAPAVTVFQPVTP